jgi:hypothetical protein
MFPVFIKGILKIGDRRYELVKSVLTAVVVFNDGRHILY